MRTFIFAVVLALHYLCKNVDSKYTSGTNMLKFLNMSSDYKRPIMYTFMHIEGSNASLDQDSILVWAKAWADFGWDPVVLTEIDASRNPDYETYVKKLSLSGLPQNGWGRFLRYLAMSSLEGGGYYTEPFVYPINHAFSFDGKGFILPNGGKFTTYDGDHLSLLSGNEQEWNRITSVIMNHNDQHMYNDALMLKSLAQENTKHHYIEDSFVDLPYILGLRNMLDAKPFCKDLQKKKATKLITNVMSVGFSNHTAYYNAVKLSLDKCKPTMHTFFELAYGKNAEESLLLELSEWRKAWEGAGWNTVVLTLSDAKRHPLYEIFRKAFMTAEYSTENYDQMCFYRWLAMASTADGGWMADYDTYPLSLYQNHDYNYILPNNGTFTTNLFFVPNLVSGSKSEWNRMVELLLSNYKDHTQIFWSDMFALRDINRRKPKAYMYTYDAIELSTVYSLPPSRIRHRQTDYGDAYFDKAAARNFPFELRRFCDMTEGKLAVHFSHGSCMRTGFCHNNRGPILNKWLETWKQQCLFDA